jgi:hypothetical protein
MDRESIDDFLGSFDDDDDDDDDYDDDGENDESIQFIGSNWVMPSKATTNDGDDTDSDVVDFFFENETSVRRPTEQGTETVDTARSVGTGTPIYFDVGIDGRMMETGPLSFKMYNAIRARKTMVDIPTRMMYELILKTTAKQAVKLTLQQSGLQLAVENDFDDSGWGTIESIRMEQEDDGISSDIPSVTFDSWDSMLSFSGDGDDKYGWTPGKSFSFILRNVPTYRKAVSLDELLSSLDPDGSLRNQALDAGLIDDFNYDDGDDDEVEEYQPVTCLKELFEDNYRRVQHAPRAVEDRNNVYVGSDNGGYRLIHANDLLSMVHDINGRLDNNETISRNLLKKYKNITMHVMDAFVSHGCLLVDVTDGGNNQSRANSLHQMWKATESFYHNVANNKENHTALPSWTSVTEAGSGHAKVGYQSLMNTSMSVLETRQRVTDGQLLPLETKTLFGTDGYNAMLNSFDVITELCQAAIQIAVGASIMEIGINDATIAMAGAKRLVHEMVDNGKPVSMVVPNSANNSFPVSMSPHRLLQYGKVQNGSNSKNSNYNGNMHDANDAEIFGAHTDTTFITAVPVAAVAGLEVYDEDAQLWYRPEFAIQQRYHYSDNGDNMIVEDTAMLLPPPWYTRYVVLMPGELLQISTCNEIPAAVHRVIDGSFSTNSDESSHPLSSSSSIRYSAPVLLRGRSGVVFDCERYFGICPPDSSQQLDQQRELSTTWPVWTECQNMTMDQIYNSLQGRPDVTNKT